MAGSTLPETHSALIVRATGKPLELEACTTPLLTPGTAIIRVEATGVISYTNEIYNGKRHYPYPTPFIPGSAAVGKVVSVAPDATFIKPGDFVSTDIVLRGRDDPNTRAMLGYHQGGSSASAKMVMEEFRHGTYAEYAKIPLENVLKLPSESPYSAAQWMSFSRALIPFGGLTNDGGLDLRPGEKIVIAPATGQFGSAAVELALAMGAQVTALGRSVDALDRLQRGLSDCGNRLQTVSISGDQEADTQAIGPVDCYFDISPAVAAESTHIKSCFLALRPFGRAVLMGSIKSDIDLPYHKLVHSNITLLGRWMYEQNAPRKLLALVEAGLFRLDRQEHKAYPLSQWKEAFEDAEERNRWGQSTHLAP